MSQTSQFGPPNQPSGGGNTVLWVLLIVGLLVLLVCGGLCAGCIVVTRQAGKALEEAGAALQVAFQEDMLVRQAQSAVKADQRVRERLGDNLQFSEHTRHGVGPLQPGGETFQFDVTGPNGTAIVSAVATGAANDWKLNNITVTFDDGSSIDVEPGAAFNFDQPDFGEPNFGDQPNFDFSAPEPETTTQP